MAELEIAYRKVSELLPYARNARKHSQKQVKQIAASIQEFGFNAPILVDEKNMIIAGHGRIEAAELLKMETVPTIRLAHLNELKGRAYNIVDNQLALNADWDLDMLAMEVQELQIADFDVRLLGFEDDELAKLMDSIGRASLPDDLGPDEKPITQMTFILHVDQAEEITEALSEMKKDPIGYPGNENRNGNALHRMVMQWVAQKK